MNDLEKINKIFENDRGELPKKSSIFLRITDPLRKAVARQKECTEFYAPQQQAYFHNTRRRGRSPIPTFGLVKDDGIYLIAMEVRHQLVPINERMFYLVGCRPVDPGYLDRIEDFCSHDFFAAILTADIQEAIDHDANWLEFEMDEATEQVTMKWEPGDGSGTLPYDRLPEDFPVDYA